MDLGGIQVSGMCHGSGVIAVVPVFDDRVKEFSKYLQEDIKMFSLYYLELL